MVNGKRVWWYYLKCDYEYAEELMEIGWAKSALRFVEATEKKMEMTKGEKLDWKLLKSRIHFRLGDCDSALKFAEEVLTEALDIDNFEVILFAIAAKFDPLYKKNRIEECFRLIVTTETYLEKIKNSNSKFLNDCTAPILRAQGNLYFSKGDFPKALELFSRSLIIYTEINNPYQIMRTHVRIADTLGCMKDYKESINSYMKALAISEEIGDFEWQSNISNSISEIYSYLGKSDLSTKYDLISHQLMKRHEQREMKELYSEVDEFIGEEEE